MEIVEQSIITENENSEANLLDKEDKMYVLNNVEGDA